MGFVVLIGEGYSVVEAPDGFDWLHMIGIYAGIPFYILLYGVYKYTYKTKTVPLMECDLVSGLMPIKDDDLVQVSTKSRLEAFRRRANHFFKKS